MKKLMHNLLLFAAVSAFVFDTAGGQSTTYSTNDPALFATDAPSTGVPTTPTPTTSAPTTQAPTTQAPTTQAPITQAPTTQAATTQAPTTHALTTQAPTTQAPTTQAPTTQAPTTIAPTASSTYLPEDQNPGTTIFTIPVNYTTCVNAKADIHFLLDASGSIGSANYQKQLDWVKSFARQFTIGSNAVQIGVTTFSSTAHNEFWMNSHQNVAELDQAVDNIGYASQTTHTELGLEFVRQQAFTPQHGDRPGVANILVVVTDGQSVSPTATLAEAAELHKLNINTISVGVGSGVDKAELATIASDPANVYTVSNFDALHTIEAQIREATCTQAATSKCDAPIDLVFLVDKSASINNQEYDIEKEFIKKMIDQFHISPSEVQVAMALFANNVRHKWCFTDHQSQQDLEQAVATLACPECLRGHTATGHGLQWVRDYMLTSRCGTRPNAQKVVVVLTDGRTTEQPHSVFTDAAQNLKRTGATVIAVGVGEHLNRPGKHSAQTGLEELQTMASDPKYVFRADNFDKLLPLLDSVATSACRAPVYTPVCDKPIDLAIMVDKSETRPEFITEQAFLEQLVGKFEIGSSSTQVALGQFSTGVTPGFCFTNHTNLADLQTAIGNLKCSHSCHEGPASTANALTYARTHLLKANCGLRNNSAHVVVVLTDSHHAGGNKRFNSSTTNIHNKAHVIAVGVGDKVPHDELEMIASNHSMVFAPSDYTHLQSVLDAVANAACDLGPSKPSVSTTQTACSAEQQRKACAIFQSEEDGNIELARYHKSGVYDTATAYNNVLDMCDGKKSGRSSYACADCPGGSPGGAVCINNSVLDYVQELTVNGSLIVNQLTGGCYDCNSPHYQGLAVDVSGPSDGSPSRTAEFAQKCAARGGAATSNASSAGGSGSVTCVFPAAGGSVATG